jgi:hypothetical protein
MSLPLLLSLIGTRTIVLPFEIPHDRAVRLVLCDVRGVVPNVSTVADLARLQLCARRRGCEIKLCNTSRELGELLVFMGLHDALPEWRPAL